MNATDWVAVATVVNVLCTIALVCVTWWYASTTRRLLKSAWDQNKMLSKSAQIQAWGALSGAAAHPTGANPFQRLRELALELQECDQQDSSP